MSLIQHLLHWLKWDATVIFDLMDKPQRTEINDFITSNELDLLFTTETWLKGDGTDNVDESIANRYQFINIAWHVGFFLPRFLANIPFSLNFMSYYTRTFT